MTKYLYLLFALFGTLSSFVARSQAPIKVMVYPGTELVEVIQLLADSIPPAQSTYNQEVLTYFQPYKNHPAVQLARSLYHKRQVSCDFPVRCSWALYNFPDLKVATMTDMNGYEKIFDMAQTQAFFQACASFYHDSNFWQFFQQHTPLYNSWVSSFERGLYQGGQLATLEKFYRLKRSKEVIITLGALNCGTYAVANMNGINPVFGDKTVVMLAYWQVAQGPGNQGQRADFYAPARTSQLVWHELGHAYIAKAFERHQAQINSLAYIMQQDSLVRKYAAMRGGWVNYLNENTTQAVTSLLKIRNGLEKREEELETSPDSFYQFLPTLVAIIEQDYYGTKRYRDFEAFFPVFLAKIKAKYPPHPVPKR